MLDGIMIGAGNADLDVNARRSAESSPARP